MYRRLTCLILSFVMSFCVMAQNVSYEYWVDADYQKRVLGSGGTESVSFAIDISNYVEGAHFLNFRAKQDKGTWGSLNRQLFVVQKNNALISQYESWLDDQYDQRIITQHTDGDVVQAIDVSNLVPGVHYYNMRIQNANGQWGSLYRCLFLKPEISVDRKPKAVEYWIDNDSINTTLAEINDSIVVLNIDISQLAAGSHVLHCLLQDVIGYGGDEYAYEFTLDNTAEPYTVLSEKKDTLTFYYDNKRVERGGSILGKTFSYISERSWDRSAESIKTAVFDESFSNYNDLQGTCYWFFNCKNLTEIIGLQYLKTDRVYDMRCMFEYCSSLTSLDLSSFSTKSAYILTGMFNGCSALTTLNLSGFNTAITQYMVGMFMDCQKLKTIYVDKTWSTKSIINGDNMFSGCTSLVGGSGTPFDINHIDQEYARIDGGAAAPGYFTDVNDVSGVKCARVLQQADRQYFTIDGRKIFGQSTFKGIYIVNGKVIVKQ